MSLLTVSNVAWITGLFLVAAGQAGVWYFGKKEAKDRENVIKAERDEAQRRLEEVIEEVSKTTIKDEFRANKILEEARKYLNDRKKISQAQRRAVTGRKSR